MISDMITRSEEKASADDTHNAIHKASEAKQINLCAFDPKLVVYFSTQSWPEVMNIYHFSHASNTISYRETLNQCKTSFDACSLQPTNGAAGEYAGLLVIRKYQENIGQDLGMKSAHGAKPDSAVTSHIDMKFKSCQSQGLSLEKLMSVQQELRRTRQETEDVKENKLKDLIIVHCYQVDNEMVAVRVELLAEHRH